MDRPIFIAYLVMVEGWPNRDVAALLGVHASTIERTLLLFHHINILPRTPEVDLAELLPTVFCVD